jgi:hypothetical protein
VWAVGPNSGLKPSVRQYVFSLRVPSEPTIGIQALASCHLGFLLKSVVDVALLAGWDELVTWGFG